MWPWKQQGERVVRGGPPFYNWTEQWHTFSGGPSEQHGREGLSQGSKAKSLCRIYCWSKGWETIGGSQTVHCSLQGQHKHLTENWAPALYRRLPSQINTPANQQHFFCSITPLLPHNLTPRMEDVEVTQWDGDERMEEWGRKQTRRPIMPHTFGPFSHCRFLAQVRANLGEKLVLI